MSEKFKQIIVASLGKETRDCMGQFELRGIGFFLFSSLQFEREFLSFFLHLNAAGDGQ